MDERTSNTSAGHRADAAGRGRRTRGQRNFLGIYDLMLKTLQLDYASCARYEASGYSEFIGQLYTLNSGMFQSSRYCDRTLTQMILHYLTWFQDPGLQLLVGPGAAWRVSQDFGTQRYGDALYVTWARPGAQVAKGEAIVAINGQALEEIRPEVERTLWTTAEPVDHEREDWSVVLAFARHVTVRGADGGERVVKLASYEGVPGTGASDEGSGAQSALAQGVDLPACELVRQGEVVVLTLRRPTDAAFAGELGGLLEEARAARRLVIDVRGARGGGQQDVYPLVDLVLAPGQEATPAELFGPDGVVMNYTRHNVDARIAELEALRAQEACADARAASETQTDGSAALDGQIDAAIEDMRAKRGKGMVRELGGFYPDVRFAAPATAGDRHVAILADRFTGEAAEWLVRAARSAGHARVMGRATLGSLDNTSPRVVRLDHDFSLVVPTATYLAAYEGQATIGRGIVPDVHLAWAPEQLERDVELERACTSLAD